MLVRNSGYASRDACYGLYLTAEGKRYHMCCMDSTLTRTDEFHLAECPTCKRHIRTSSDYGAVKVVTEMRKSIFIDGQPLVLLSLTSTVEDPADMPPNEK